MDKFNEIKCILLKTFNKLSHRHATTITTLIIAVNDGVKIGYIWDIGPPVTIIQIQNLIKQLKLSNLIKNSLCIVSILDDVCILNVRKYLSLEIKPIFIDISKNLSSPKLISLTINQHIQSIIDIIHTKLLEYSVHIGDDDDDDGDTNLIILDLDKNLYCIPTAIGLLAGYPIIYWYDVSMNDCHCLYGDELIVYKVMQGNELILSFSCPKLLNSSKEIQDLLKEWKENFKGLQITESISKSNNAISL